MSAKTQINQVALSVSFFIHFEFDRLRSKVALLSPCKWRPEVGTRLLWPRLKAPNASVCHFCRHWPKILVTVCPIFSPPPSPFPTSRPDCSIPSGGHLSQLKRPLLTLRQELLAPIFQHSSTSGGIFHAPHFTYIVCARLTLF